MLLIQLKVSIIPNKQEHYSWITIL